MALYLRFSGLPERSTIFRRESVAPFFNYSLILAKIKKVYSSIYWTSEISVDPNVRGLPFLGRYTVPEQISRLVFFFKKQLIPRIAESLGKSRADDFTGVTCERLNDCRQLRVHDGDERGCD